MRIALAQIASTPGDFEGTVGKMLDFARQAKVKGADLVVFPASALCGVYASGPGGSSACMLDMLAAVEDFAARTPLPSAVPMQVCDGGPAYTEVFLCADSNACPLRLRLSRRPAQVDPCPGGVDAVWEVDGLEIRFVVDAARMVEFESTSDVSLVLVPVAFSDVDPTGLGAAGLADGALASVAEGACGWLGFVQGVGAYDDTVLAGGSFAASPDGRLAAVCACFEEDLCVFDAVPLSELEACDGPDDEPCRPAAPGVRVDSVQGLDDDARCAFLWRALAIAVRDYVRKSGFSDVAIGLSGGIDSAVVAAIAADALGSEHVRGVLMPGPYSSEGSVSDALDLAGRLGIRTCTVPITGLYEVAVPLLGDALGAGLPGLARENLQARLRGTALMAVSNATGALVLSTGNKSEAGMGYSTLYGDTVGAYSPLCDIYKGRVYELARWRNRVGGSPVIPESTIAKPPSAELSDDQTDEASFGASYETIDRILQMHVERGMDATEIAREGIDAATVERVLDACRKAEFKRRQEPFGPLVSLAPFVDRGWPVVFAWRDRVRPVARPAADPELEPIGGERVALALDDMLQRSMRSDQIVGMVGDVVFGAFVSGRGPEMDDVMGIPLFSKN